MSLTVETAIKAALESDRVGVPVYTRRPQGQVMPYVLIMGPITAPRDPDDAPFSDSSRKGIIPEYQVDVWQNALGDPDTNGRRLRVFDPTLPDKVAAALDGRDLSGAGTPFRIFACQVLNGPTEIPTPIQNNVVHHVIDVQVWRNLA